MMIALLAVIAIALLYVCYTDIRWRTINNSTVGLIAICSLGLGWVTSGQIAILFPLSILVIGFILSLINVIGAGDVKLLVALSFGLTNNQISDFLILTALAGLPVILVIFIIYKLFLRNLKMDVPYGTAITLGYFAQWLISHQ